MTISGAHPPDLDLDINEWESHNEYDDELIDEAVNDIGYEDDDDIDMSLRDLVGNNIQMKK